MKEVRINFVNSTRDPPKKIQKARCYPNLLLESPFGSCKSISGKYYIFRKYYFPERKMFSCVWLHFKKCFGKYFLVFGCVLENTIENTFSTCYSHFLTFSRLSNEYIISFIPQYRNINKTQKKNHQIWSHFLTFSRLPNNRNTNKHRNKNILVKYRNTNIFWVWWGAAIVRSTAPIAIGAKARSRSTRCFTRSRSMVRAFAIDALRHHNRREGKIAIGSVLRAILANDLGDRSFGRSRRARLSLWRDRSFGRSLYFRGWALSFSGSLSLLRVEGNGLKVKWICKMISESNEQNFSQTEIIFQKFYFP